MRNSTPLDGSSKTPATRTSPCLPPKSSQQYALIEKEGLWVTL
jgi:hypothetical protein